MNWVGRVKVWTTSNDVTIIGYADMPARMAEQTSAKFRQNMVNMLRHLHGSSGSTILLSNIGRHLGAGAPDGDIIARSIVCCRNGKKFEMSPPSQPTPPKPKTEIVGLKNAVILLIAIGNVWSDETVCFCWPVFLWWELVDTNPCGASLTHCTLR